MDILCWRRTELAHPARPRRAGRERIRSRYQESVRRRRLNELDEKPVFVFLAELACQGGEAASRVVASGSVEVIVETISRLGGYDILGPHRTAHTRRPFPSLCSSSNGYSATGFGPDIQNSSGASAIFVYIERLNLSGKHCRVNSAMLPQRRR